MMIVNSEKVRIWKEWPWPIWKGLSWHSYGRLRKIMET